MTEQLIKLDVTRAPDLIIPPGETLREELLARGLTQAEFAEKLGRSLKAISAIINGRKAITAETALQFEDALGIPANFWLNLESQYRLDLARKERSQ